MAITPNDPANFVPNRGSYKELKPFRFWCQKVLPLVYDDSLSYYELLNKVVNYLNMAMEDVTTLEGDVTNLHTAYVQLQTYVNDYFVSLDVQEEIDIKLDEMAESGALSELLSPLIPDLVTEWLDENITPTTPPIDKTLTIEGAGADAKVVGEKFDLVEDDVNKINAFLNVESKNTNYAEGSNLGGVLSATNRWFLNGTVEGVIKSVTIRNQNVGFFDIEIWRVDDNTLTRVYINEIEATTEYTTKTYDIDYDVSGKYMVSVQPKDGYVVQWLNNSNYNTLRTTDLSSVSLNVTSLSSFASMCVYGYVTYENSVIEDLATKSYVDEVNAKADENKDDIDSIENLLAFGSSNTNYAEGSNVGGVLSDTNRWFLNGVVNGVIESITLRNQQTGSFVVEVWSVNGNSLTKVYEETLSGTSTYDLKTYDIDYNVSGNYMVSVKPIDTYVVQWLNNSNYNTLRTTDLVSEELAISGLTSFPDMCVYGYVTYESSIIDSLASIDYVDAQIRGVLGNVITVGVNSKYTSINEAIASASDGDTILIHPGTYTEDVRAWGKTLNIVGVCKTSCIIVNDTGNYETPAIEIDSGYLGNLTIISNAENPTLDSDNANYMRDYSIHVDHAHATGKTLIIENCIIMNNHRACLGIGLYDNNTVTVKDCDIWSGIPPANIQNPNWNKRGAVYFHNRQPSASFPNVTNQKLRIVNCRIYCDDIIAIYQGDTTSGIDMEGNNWINEMEVEFINNMICAKKNGNYNISCEGISLPPNFEINSIIGGYPFTNDFKLSTISYGNNLSCYNN